jgi:hypothetical protein
MKTNRPWFILSVCLAGALACWTIIHLRVQPMGNASAAKIAPISAAIADAPASPPLTESPVETLRPFAELDGLRFDVLPADEETALANPDSPRNSPDFDHNRNWAREFPAEASAWLFRAPDSPQRDIVAEIVCPQLAQTNPAVAVALAEHCYGNGTNVMGNLLDNRAQLWAERDEQSAFTWASAKPPGEGRDRLLQRIALVQATTDPEQAAQMIAEQISPGSIQNEAAISVLYQWAHQNAAAALAWAQSFPAGDFRDRAIREVQNVKVVSSGGQAVF